MNKWNEFFEKQALDDLKAPEPSNQQPGEPSETDAENAGENAEKNINDSAGEQKNGIEPKTETKTEQKGTENNEGSEQETGRKETETV